MQNQCGPHPNKWDKSGVIVECKPFDQYIIKIDGSGRLTLCNRKCLRHFTLPVSKIDVKVPMTTEADRSSDALTPSFEGVDLVQEGPQEKNKFSPFQQSGIPLYIPEDNIGKAIIADEDPHGKLWPTGRLVVIPPVAPRSCDEALEPSAPGLSGLVDNRECSFTESESSKRPRKSPKRYVPVSGNWE